jgi:hypothetical protein
MRDWQPIETVPDDTEFIIAAWPCSGAEFGFDVGEAVRDGAIWSNYFGRCEPTHWMPLPDPPKVIEVERIAVSDDQSQAIPEARHQGQKMREGLR